MSKSISARIDDSLHAKLLERCNIDGLTVSDELNQILNGSLTCSSSIDSKKNAVNKDNFIKILESAPKEIDNIDRSNLEQWVNDLERAKRV